MFAAAWGRSGIYNHELMDWLQSSRWHYDWPSDVLIHGARRPTAVTALSHGGRRFYRRNIGLWPDGITIAVICVFLLLPRQIKNRKAMTDELPPRHSLWQYAPRFRVVF